MNNLDWTGIKLFLAVAQAGSLSAAARQVGVSQPTLTRAIQQLEEVTRLNLFRRTTQGVQITEAGLSLLETAQHMAEAAERFDRQVSGMAQDLEGEVRISVNEIVGIYLLPAALAEFRRAHPAVQLEVVISNRASSLSKREADIALRMFRPEQPDLVARRLPDLALGFYAHHDYVRQYGEPASVEDLRHHTIIGFDQDMDFIDGAARQGYQFARSDFPLRTDHMLMQIHLARAGAGIVATHCDLAVHWPELQHIMRWVPLPSLEFWVVCHRDVQSNSRIRVLMNFLCQWFAEQPYRQALV